MVDFTFYTCIGLFVLVTAGIFIISYIALVRYILKLDSVEESVAAVICILLVVTAIRFILYPLGVFISGL